MAPLHPWTSLHPWSWPRMALMATDVYILGHGHGCIHPWSLIYDPYIRGLTFMTLPVMTSLEGPEVLEGL